MFTGLIEAVGTVSDIAPQADGCRIRVRTALAAELADGDSVAVNGVCLTTTAARDGELHADIGGGTVRVTTLGSLRVGQTVNLERAMRADARFGGHFVQGHVDATGVVEAVREQGDSHWVTIAFPAALAAYLVPKGSVAVDGVSLTVAELAAASFDATIIPFTWSHTNVSALRPGDRVNLECDMVGKYVARTLELRGDQGFADRGSPIPGPQSQVMKKNPQIRMAKGARRAMPFAPIEEAVEAIRAGRMIIVVDDEDRENEGDLTMAASKVTPAAINFMARHGRGQICLSMTGLWLDELEIPLAVSSNTTPFGTAFCVPIDAKAKVSTGISAADRAATVLAAIHPKTKPSDLARPGHVSPLRARDGGVMVRAGQTEAAVDLARMAGLYEAGVICEIMNEDGTMARVPELRKFSKKHGLLIITIADLIQYRMRNERLVKRIAQAAMPAQHGEFRIFAFGSELDHETHVALVRGEIGDGKDVLVRVHSKCLTGDVFHSARCDCGAQLDAALAQIAKEGRGVLLYLNQEGRGIGLANKIRAYELQDQGLDTVEANERLGFKADQRDYGIGAQILSDLGVKTMRLLTNNPRKFVGLQGYGLAVSEAVPLEIPANDSTRRYLKTKKDKLGHTLSSV